MSAHRLTVQLFACSVNGQQRHRTDELAQAPLRGDVPQAQRAIRGADEQRVQARRVAALQSVHFFIGLETINIGTAFTTWNLKGRNV